MEEEESLDCPVCFERYDVGPRTPKMMPCLHTVCATCILDLLTLKHQQGASEPEIPKGQDVTCPLCRETISSDKLQTNRYIVAHLRHVIRLEGMTDGESRHRDQHVTSADRARALGVPVFPLAQQPPRRTAPTPPSPRSLTPPSPPQKTRAPPPPHPMLSDTRRATAPLPPSAAPQHQRTAPPPSGIVAQPPRPFPFGGPQQSPPPPAYPSPPPSSCAPPPAYPSPQPSSCASPLSYSSPSLSACAPPPAYPSPAAYSSPSTYPQPSTHLLSPLAHPPPTPPSPATPLQNNQDRLYPTLSRFSDDSRDPSPRPLSAPTTPVEPCQDAVSPSAPPALANLDEGLWCRTCDEPAKNFCIDHEIIPLLKGDEVAWIEEQQKKYDQEQQDLALALRLAETSLEDTPDSASPPAPAPPSAHAQSPTTIIPVGRNQGVWKGKAFSKAKKIDLSKWRYDEIRDTINTSCDAMLIKACREEFHQRLKNYTAWKRNKNKKET
ncbi:pollen-specific leucine-rich repeat extensin-like protein 1 isoform X2 [Penaeus japonicus]|uniref:pollen-specific leucine-rich repeat extensin-like protein 1 isoform X2 n=1 Tax=Penaeus japonicus TaxID=27405 RepID=UPI001C70E5E0|nr:pollen-specific leucine-rich repeat extensin-like protein 1 isoform X2 [Penaeus japonicus]